jgi:mRNA interferase RelE/StbE
LVWKIEFDLHTERDLKKIDPVSQKRIFHFLKERLAPLKDPRTLGEALHGEKLGDFWKYRVGNYRIICKIEDKTIKILVIRIEHRKDIYK